MIINSHAFLGCVGETRSQASSLVSLKLIREAIASVGPAKSKESWSLKEPLMQREWAEMLQCIMVDKEVEMELHLGTCWPSCRTWDGIELTMVTAACGTCGEGSGGTFTQVLSTTRAALRSSSNS